MQNQANVINVAPSSTHGHFVKKAKKVVDLDSINETFLVEVNEEATMVSENHLELPVNEDCLVVCQKTFNGFSALYEQSRD